RNGEIKRYPNPFMIMKTVFVKKIKKYFNIGTLHTLFKVLEKMGSWTEITISFEDLRSIAKGRTLGNDQLNRIVFDGLDREETFLRLTRENLNCLDVKIDGTDFSAVSGRAWAIANRFQRENFIKAFNRFKTMYKEKFPNKNYHTNQPRWVNKVASDYNPPASSLVPSQVPFPVPLTPICPSTSTDINENNNLFLTEKILFRGDLGD
ncbi:6171_t:CDS:1, partial [Dentiscutata heterogama]